MVDVKRAQRHGLPPRCDKVLHELLKHGRGTPLFTMDSDGRSGRVDGLDLELRRLRR